MSNVVKEAAKGLIMSTESGRELMQVRELVPHLRRIGWLRSIEERMPLDREGNPLPWYTYPAISFLGERVKPYMDVFEYGSGNSTLWWSKRISHVTSCEHDHSWYEKMKPQLPANVDYIYCELDYGGQYCHIISPFQNCFDCIVIDGRDRVNCAKNSIGALKKDGVIIWDNGEREKYQEGYDYLVRQGFRRLNFWGPGPINNFDWCTALFYRPDNCLGI